MPGGGADRYHNGCCQTKHLCESTSASAGAQSRGSVGGRADLPVQGADHASILYPEFMTRVEEGLPMRAHLCESSVLAGAHHKGSGATRVGRRTSRFSRAQHLFHIPKTVHSNGRAASIRPRVSARTCGSSLVIIARASATLEQVVGRIQARGIDW